MSLNVDAFLDQEGIKVDTDIPSLLNQIIQESVRGLKGKASSLRMFNTYITRKINHSNRQSLKLVIDAGGTNFRVVLLSFLEKSPKILYYQRHPMPGSQGTVKKDFFFEQIVDYLEPVLTRQDLKDIDPNFTGFTSIQFCFSYPIRIESSDTYVVGMSKEISITGIIGEPIKKNLLHTLHSRGYSTIQNVVILNDTCATLLAGYHEKMSSNHLSNIDGFMGIVWGTGFNIAYEENYFFSKPYIINSEAGGYSKFSMATIDQMLDSRSLKPGDFLAEKKISGYYFPLMVKLLLQRLITYKSHTSNLSPQFYKIIKNSKFNLKSEHISQFLQPSNLSSDKPLFFFVNKEESSQIISQVDLIYLRTIIERLSSRSACLTALLVAGLMLQSLGLTPTLPTGKNWKKFCLVLDGSMVRKMPGVKEKFTEYLKQFCESRHIQYEILEIDRAPIIGTSIASYDFS